MSLLSETEPVCSPIYPTIVGHYRKMPDRVLLIIAENHAALIAEDKGLLPCLCRELARRFASALASLREAERRQKCGCYGTSCSECDAAEAVEAR